MNNCDTQQSSVIEFVNRASELALIDVNALNGRRFLTAELTAKPMINSKLWWFLMDNKTRK